MNKYVALVKIRDNDIKFFIGVYGKRIERMEMTLRSKGYSVLCKMINSERHDELIIMGYQDARNRFQIDSEDYLFLVKNWERIVYRNVDDVESYISPLPTVESLLQK